MKKLFLCVGAAKTGTTWLYRQLEPNPDLWFAPEKEINYFFSRHGWFDRLTDRHRTEKRDRFLENAAGVGENADRRREWYRRYGEGPIDETWYRRLYEDGPGDRWMCDFSPSTSLISAEGWAEIAAFAEELRIVYILREPGDRLWSHAKFHAQFTNQLDEFSAMSIDDMNRFIKKARLETDGDYGEHLEKMLTAIPRDKILLIDYGRIAEEPQKVLRQVERFLGVGRTEPPMRPRDRVNVSAPLPKPAKFGVEFHKRFRADTARLVELGVEFAKPWRSRYAEPMKRVQYFLERLTGR
ncbi:MAG: sulfotransferase [Pseudomonadota bacterium]